jgi:hypothetical protein
MEIGMKETIAKVVSFDGSLEFTTRTAPGAQIQVTATSKNNEASFQLSTRSLISLNVALSGWLDRNDADEC